MDNTKKIAELEKELNELKSENETFNSLPEDKRLAEFLHEKLCYLNHTDGCGWFYESWDKIGYAKKEYLKKSQDMLKVSDFKTISEIIDKL